ncbi:MAG: hypothetical protein V4587_14785 [Acidobacteriota bacterium]
MDNQKRRDLYPSWFLFLAFLVSLIIASILKRHVNGNVAWGAGVCSGALIFVAKTRWDLRGEWWFWGALVVGASLQLPLVLFLPWLHKYLSGPAATILVIPGFVMALGCVFLAEKVFAKSSSPKC